MQTEVRIGWSCSLKQPKSLRMEIMSRQTNMIADKNALKQIYIQTRRANMT